MAPSPPLGGGGDPDGDSGEGDPDEYDDDDDFEGIGDDEGDRDRRSGNRRRSPGDPDGDDLPNGGRGRARRAATPPVLAVRVKEAESIKVAAFPEPPAFRNWKSALRQEVAAASGRPDEAFGWFQAIDHMSFEALANPGAFSTLDTKLGAALQKGGPR